MRSKQIETTNSQGEQRLRDRLQRAALDRVLNALPSKQCLSNPNRGYAVSRGSNPVNYAEHQQSLLRDCALAAARTGSSEVIERVRHAITEFYRYEAHEVLALLPDPGELTCVIPLFRQATRESGEATCAVAEAITLQSVEALDDAIQQQAEDVAVGNRLLDGLHRKRSVVVLGASRRTYRGRHLS